MPLQRLDWLHDPVHSTPSVRPGQRLAETGCRRWRPGFVAGAAFHGVRQEIRGLGQELKTDIQAVETRLRAHLSEFKTEVRSDIVELRADYRALNQKLDRVLETLLQP